MTESRATLRQKAAEENQNEPISLVLTTETVTPANSRSLFMSIRIAQDLAQRALQNSGPKPQQRSCGAEKTRFGLFACAPIRSTKGEVNLATQKSRTSHLGVCTAYCVTNRVGHVLRSCRTSDVRCDDAIGTYLFNSALLMDGTALEILRSGVTAVIGMFLRSSGVQGWFVGSRSASSIRVFLIVAALFLVFDGLLTDLIGIRLAVLAWFVLRILHLNPDAPIPVRGLD